MYFDYDVIGSLIFFSLIIFVCFFAIFRSWYFHAGVFGKTPVHEFPCPIAILNGTVLFFWEPK